MSVKYFCDVCGEEITATNEVIGDRLKTRDDNARLAVEVITGLGTNDGRTNNRPATVWNAGHFCKYCVIDAVKAFDDRPETTRR